MVYLNINKYRTKNSANDSDTAMQVMKEPRVRLKSSIKESVEAFVVLELYSYFWMNLRMTQRCKW